MQFLELFFILVIFLGLVILVSIELARANQRLRRERQREAEYQEYLKRKIHGLINNTATVTPEEFFELRNSKVKRSNSIAGKIYNFPGVYVLHNQTKDMYYVGQGVKVLDRVNNHFTGKGNGDVYADYKYNDNFKIGIIPFNNSDFSSLNELERLAIKTYNSYTKGYNKTKGNQG